MTFNNLFRLTDRSSFRASSWDRRGRNNDFINIGSKQTKVLADIKGPGIINHIYFTMIAPNPLDFRNAIIRMYWDDEENPSVEVPLGDFFGVCNCRIRTINSLMITITKGIIASYGFNIYFPMPFSKRALIEIENQGEVPIGGYLRAFWYHIDYDLVKEPWSEETGYFHAFWNRENPTTVSEIVLKRKQKNKQMWMGKNLTGDDNYIILETEGNGQLVGLILAVDNQAGGWWGEGDDCLQIDDDSWPPSIHGTGTEEIFGGGASPNKEYNTPYTGFHIVENIDYAGNNGMYRWYIHDSIRFKKKIRWTIEHGHANNFENDYSSVAYWYQQEPHKKFPLILDVKDRLPRIPVNLTEMYDKVVNIGLKSFVLKDILQEQTSLDINKMIDDAAFGFMEGKYEITEKILKTLEKLLGNR